MKALDTSVLARYYTMDEPRQAKIATRIIAALTTGASRGGQGTPESGPV